MKIDEKHPMLTSQEDIKAICKPLAEHFDITSFVYQRSYNDGRDIKLGTNAKWLVNFYEKEYYRNSIFEGNAQDYQPGHVAWSHIQGHSEVLDAAWDFDIDHGLTIIEPNADGCEFYFLGTSRENKHTAHLCLNNIDLLKRFNLYFKDKAKGLIDKVAQQAIVIPHKEQEVVTDKSYIRLLNTQLNRHSFLDEVKIKRYPLKNGKHLTGKEFACAEQLVQGKSAKEIARILMLSPRTVETHLDNLKTKLDCYNRSELITFLKRECDYL